MLLVTRRAKMPLQGVLPPPPIKSRRTPENAVQRIYIKYGNTKSLKLYAVQGQHTIIYIGMPFPAVLVRRTISGFLYFQIMGNFVVRRFWRLNGILYP